MSTTRPLNADQVAHWHDDGYLLARKLFSTEEIDLLLKIARSDQLVAKSAGRQDSQGNVSRLTLRNDLYDDTYSGFVRCRRVVDAMEQLLDDEVYHFHHKMMLKEPLVGGAWEWHQDYGYWYQNNFCMYPDMGSCLIAIDRANKENGCLQVIRGSHKLGRVNHGTTGTQTGADMERVDAALNVLKLDLVHAELEPGDALFFHANTLHRSDQNRSPNPRWSLIGCYNTKHNNPYKHVPGGHPMYTPLEKWDDARVLETAKREWAQRQKMPTTNQGIHVSA
ncbi:MAG: phytanoyl-CoA dioxygenase family protein [Tepidisphaeraceae bacterium]